MHVCIFSEHRNSAPVSWFFNFSSSLLDPLKLNLLELGGLCNLFLFIFYQNIIVFSFSWFLIFVKIYLFLLFILDWKWRPKLNKRSSSRILFIFVFQKYLKKIKLNFIFFYFKSNIFLMFLNYFDALILKIIFKNKKILF